MKLGLKNALTERILIPIKKRLREEKGLIAPLSTVTWRISPATSFSTLLNNYLSDIEIAMGIDFLAEAIVGSGFYITSDDNKAKKIVEEFCNVPKKLKKPIDVKKLLDRRTLHLVAALFLP